jgi:Holliday junction resolvase RusA-like endonuclease
MSSIEAIVAAMADGTTAEDAVALLAGHELDPKDLKKAAAYVLEQNEGNAHEHLQIVVPGDPPVSKRPRNTRIRNAAGAVVGTRTYAADGAEQATMAEEVRRRLPEGHVPYEGEVILHFQIFRPMLAGFPKYKRILAELGYVRPESKPDYDNFSKILTDALRGIVFLDDGQVVVGNVSLYYSIRPRLEIFVSGRRRRMNK